jgi:hypothetical protein
MTMLIAFSGLKGSGKDTAAKVLIEEYGFTKIAFADPLREALYTLNPLVPVEYKVCHEGHELNIRDYVTLNKLVEAEGYEKAKRENPEFRRLMQVFGTEVGRQLFGENVWVDILEKRFPDIRDPNTRYVITDCRFVNEAKFVDRVGGSIIWITRPGVESDGHASESEEVKPWRSYHILNDFTPGELRNKVILTMLRERIDPIERSITEATN